MQYESSDTIPAIQIYAELLRNIRAISIIITVHKDTESPTTARVSTRGEVFTVIHKDAEAKVRLPCKAKYLNNKTGDTSLPLSKAAPSNSGTCELTARLALPNPDVDEEEDEIGDTVPWDADTISRSVGFGCQKCGKNLLKTKRVSHWQDLPHDDWAEMMDLWHCHKPHDESKDDENVGTGRGYSASNGGNLMVKPGRGYVGDAYVLVSMEDCENSIDEFERGILSCSSCGNELGKVDQLSGSRKLLKWGLGLECHKASYSYPVEKWFSAQLAQTINSDGIRKFIVETPDQGDSSRVLLLWVFTPDVMFSSTVNCERRLDPTRAMKILWKSGRDNAVIQNHRRQQATVDTVVMQTREFDQIHKALQNSCLLLPTSMRELNSWNVGVLERFVAADLSLA